MSNENFKLTHGFLELKGKIKETNSGAFSFFWLAVLSGIVLLFAVAFTAIESYKTFSPNSVIDLGLPFIWVSILAFICGLIIYKSGSIGREASLSKWQLELLQICSRKHATIATTPEIIYVLSIKDVPAESKLKLREFYMAWNNLQSAYSGFWVNMENFVISVLSKDCPSAFVGSLEKNTFKDVNQAAEKCQEAAKALIAELKFAKKQP